MEHLYSSTAKVQRLQLKVAEGATAVMDWVDQEGVLESFKCRLDLNFLRPGRDAPPAYNAGVAQDRLGIMFCSAALPILAGDRIVATAGPVTGTFEIKAIPDRALDYSTAHHIEVQIVETNQTLTGSSAQPSDTLPPEPTPPFEF